MSYRIAEAARRSGFSPATLRYYEEIGVLPPAPRSEAGYRLFAERDLERLAFVARARDLGCSLAEIAGLAAVWEGDRCGPVKERLRELVAAKVAGAERRIAETRVLADQLAAALAALDAPPVEGPCHDSCGCGPVAATATAGPAVACTLEPDQIAERVAAWRRLAGSALRREAIPGGARLELHPDALAEAASLLAAEHRCCTFFSFALTVDHRGACLEVTAPPEGRTVVAALVGAG